MLLCAIIEMAVEDYRLAKHHGIIVNGQLVPTKMRKLKNMDHISEVTSLIKFFHDDGLETIIEVGALQDDQGNYLDAQTISQAL
jgi:hypothetical protein